MIKPVQEIFEYHLKYLLPLKKEWFLKKKNVDVLNVDNLSPSETGEKVKAWVDKCISELY